MSNPAKITNHAFKKPFQKRKQRYFCKIARFDSAKSVLIRPDRRQNKKPPFDTAVGLL
jgi:hypothetical protein